MKPIRLACTGILILILLCGIASAEIVPDFSAIPTSGHAPLDVQFTDASTGGPTGWAWYFGDENYTAPWTLLNASSEWAGRDWHSSVATPDGSIVLTGGWDTNNKGDVWRSTNYGTTWALVNASPGWAARHAHSSVVMPDGTIVLTGGYSGGLGQNDTWLSTDNGDTWTEVNASSGWSARGYHSSVAMRDGSIVLTGGRDSDGNRLNDTWRSTDYGATWTLVNASSGWAARSHHSTVMTPDGTIVLTGGYNGSKDFNDTWRSTDNGTTWKRVNASSGWSARDGHSTVVMPDGSIVLTGGGSGADIKNDTWRSTDRGATWTLVNASSGWVARGYHSSVAMRDGRIVQMGGYDGSTFLNDTWQLMPAGSSAQNPSHTYTTPGNYKVALQAYNSAGYNSTRKSAYVTVNGGTFNISGTVYYAGAKTGPILVEAFTPLINGTFNSVGSTVISSPGPYSIAVPNGTCWLLATMDNQTGIQPTGSPINKSVYYRPDQLNVQNNLTGIDITLFEIPVTDNATFVIVENRQAHTQGDSLMHGTQPKPLNITEDLHVENTGDTSVLILDTMTVGVEGSDIADVGDPNTVWDSGHIVWDYPDRYAIQPDSNMGFAWKTDMTVTDSLPFTLNRSVNQSVFTAPAYQLLTFNASFDTMTCDWIYGNIAVYANSSAPVNATILNSTFQTDAPLLGFHPVTDQMLEFNLDEQNMQADRIYNFSVVLLVDPSQAHGQPVNYKPQILLAQGTNTGSRGGAMNDTAVMPADMLPATVTHAYLSNYFPTNWSYGNATSKQAVLKEVISIASHQAIDFTANVTSGAAPLTVQFTDASTGSPTGWAWYFGDENYTAPWMQVNASAGWSARTDDSSVSMPDGSIVVMGGYNGTGSQLNDVWRSADDGATWTEMTAHAIWSGRWGQSSVAMPDGSIVLMGGDDGSANRNDVLRSTDNGAAWTEMNASPGWDGRYHHTSVAMPDGSIVLMGGYTSSGDINDVWRSTDNGATWTQQTASAGWSPRERPVSVVMPDGSIILMGGAESSGVLKNDTWRSTDNGATWTQLTASAGWSPRVSFTSLAMPDGSIVLMGGQGYGGILTNDTWRSTDNGATWKQLTASAGWSQRDDQTSVAMPDGSIVLMGGQGYGGTTNDVWRLMPAGSSAQNPSHIYTTPGSYKVALQAYNAGGYNSTRKAGYIAVTGNNTIINMSATIFIGEEGLNVTHALNQAQGAPLDGIPPLTTIGWWESGHDISTTGPTRTIDLAAGQQYNNFLVSPANFVGYSGYWYVVGSGGTAETGAPVFNVQDPVLDLRIWDFDHSSDVTGTTVPMGTRLGFRVDTNMYMAVINPDNRGPINPATDGYINIIVKNQSGTTVPALYNDSFSAGPVAGPISVKANFVNVQPWYWGSPTASWQTGARDGTGNHATPPGTYTVMAVSTLNHMRDNYLNVGADYTGKTVSAARTITLKGTPVNFTANITTGVTPLTVRFNITQTVISPTKWNWTFGDGGNFITTVSTQRNATHTYSTSGWYTVNLTVTNATGSYMALKPAYINVTTPALPQAEFRISRDMVVQSNSNSLSSGIHNISVMNTLVIRHLADGTGTSFGNLRYSIQTNNITWVQADQSAQWNDTSATWQFPGEFTIPENSNFGPSDATSETSFQLTNISLNRGFNQTRFNSTGYQFVGGNMTLTDMTGITSAQLVINMPFPSDYVNATIVPGSFFTDAPVLSTGYSNDMIAVSLDTSAMEPGTVYNFSSVYRVEPNGTTIRYKPEVSVTLGTYYNSSAGTPGYGADMPSYLLPENVTAASVGTDTVISWHLGEEHTLVARLNNRVDPLPAANFTANSTYSHVPMVVRFNDISTGSPTAWNWSFGDGDYSELQNPVHTYTYGGNFTVSLNASNSNGFDIATKPGYIAAEPPSTDPIRVISAGGNVFIGESDLNITQSMGTNTTIAWFAPVALDSSTVPNWTIDVSGHEHAFTIDPVNFVGRNGTWYSWTGGSTLGGSPIAFNVTDPSIEIAVMDVTTGADPDGKTIPAGDQISFQLNTTIADGTTAPGVPLRIVVKRPDGTTYTTLVNSSGGATPLSILTNESVYATGPIWDTGNGLYPMGKYNITAIYDFNEMTETYPVVGRTIAQFRTINLSLSAPAPIQPLPAVKTASPSTGFNASTISFTLTGTDFQPGPGNTTVQFRNQTDILVPTLTNVTATHIDGTLVIPEDATVGPWNIRVVTDGGENTLVGKFAIIQLMKPTITGSITPLTGVRTDLVRFTLGGTNFQPGAGNTNVTLFNTTYGGIITAQLGSVTPTAIAGNFTIPADAAFGKWFVNVTTVSGGTSTSPVTFTVVQQNTPKISTITPTSGFRNRTLTVTLAGTGFQVGTGSNVSFFNQTYFTTNATSIYANVTGVTSTAITARVFFPDDAPVGPNSWLVNVTTVDGGTSTSPVTFTLLQPVPTITGSITPLNGVRTDLVTFTLSGTNFQPGAGNTTVTLFNSTYPGVITAQLGSVTPTAITGNFTIPADAAFGKWFANVTTTDGGTSTSLVPFTVTQQLKPAITSITPATGFRNRTLTVSLAGTGFQVGTGSNVSFFNQTYFTTNATSIYANITSVTSTSITARVLFPDDAPVGSNSWIVNVTTVDGGTSTTNCWFTLLKPVPTITGSITPLTGVRTSTVTFALAGTNFQPGPGNTTVTLFNTTYPGVITAQLGSVTSTSIAGNFTIPADAAFGKWFANVTTVDGGTSMSLVPFTVVQQNTPKISTITPTSGFRNRTLTVALAGSNFQVGTGSNVSFFNQTYFTTNATSIYANITSVTSTSITARVLFPDDAPVGSNSWIVNVTTVDGGTSTTNCWFTLLKPVPTITGSITPLTGVRTSTVTFTLAGTNFQPGPGNTTVTLFNSTYPGVITAQLGSVTPTAIAGNFTIPADAAFGKWFANVTTTDGGTSTSLVPFTVTQQLKPAITSITPATGFRNRTLTVALAGS
ncbi:MAG: DUF3821 domain-containing protein, partial [Methanoregula sp.]|uniref:DUF3821 domain-containing protein n=1 Tax=Methanoregula sp. TaxID=2052170 RepID=UPI003C1806C4